MRQHLIHPRIDSRQGAVELVAHPDAVRADGDRRRAVPDGERRYGIRCRVDSRDGSVRFATHTAPRPTAIPVGPFPTITGTTLPLTGSIRETLLADLAVAQRLPAPTASSVAEIGSVFVGLPLSASILVIVSSPVFATQLPGRSPAATAMTSPS
jgi:hypothetical protein